MNFPVFDLHCDTALRLLGDDGNQAGSLDQNNGHIDLTRAGKLPGYCQCFACFTTPYMEEKKWYGLSPVIVFEREIATIQREVDKNKKKIGLVYSADDIRENYEKGKMSALLAIEGPAGFGFDPELLEPMYQAGFRISTLGWNERNVLTGSNQTGEGLTDQGIRPQRAEPGHSCGREPYQRRGLLGHYEDHPGSCDRFPLQQPGGVRSCPESDGRYVPGHPGYRRRGGHQPVCGVPGGGAYPGYRL